MSRVISNELLALKLAESLTGPLVSRTRRDLRIPAIPNKAIAVIGVRRGGKTSFLAHHLAHARSTNAPAGSHLLLSLEDERLVGMTAEDLSWLLEEHRRTTSLPPETSR